MKTGVFICLLTSGKQLVSPAFRSGVPDLMSSSVYSRTNEDPFPVDLLLQALWPLNINYVSCL